MAADLGFNNTSPRDVKSINKKLVELYSGEQPWKASSVVWKVMPSAKLRMALGA